MNIYQKINEVMKEVTYVQKDAQIQGYKAVTHDQVVSVARAALVKHGIVMQVSQIEGRFDDAVNGSKMRLYHGKYSICFVNADDPKDIMSMVIEAHALDNGDKAPGKCCTYATKTAVLKALWLETGENDESREEVREKSKGLTSEQVKQLEQFCVTDNGAWTEIGTKVVMAYKIKALDQIRQANFNAVLKRCKELSDGNN